MKQIAYDGIDHYDLPEDPDELFYTLHELLGEDTRSYLYGEGKRVSRRCPFDCIVLLTSVIGRTTRRQCTCTQV